MVRVAAGETARLVQQEGIAEASILHEAQQAGMSFCISKSTWPRGLLMISTCALMLGQTTAAAVGLTVFPEVTSTTTVMQ